MKTFKEYLHENYDMPGFQGAGLSSSKIPYDIEDQEVKNKVNAILGHGQTGPTNWMIAIGQCTWSAGQLESEILSRNGRLNSDAWLTTTLNANTVFGMKYQNRWKKTVNRIAQEQFQRTFNHAVQTQ